MKKTTKILAMIIAMAISFANAVVGFGPGITVKAADYTIRGMDSYNLFRLSEVWSPITTYYGEEMVDAEYDVSIISDINNVMEFAEYLTKSERCEGGCLHIKAKKDAPLGSIAKIRVTSKNKVSHEEYATKDVNVSIIQYDIVRFNTSDIYIENGDNEKRTVSVNYIEKSITKAKFLADKYIWALDCKTDYKIDADDFFVFESDSSSTASIRLRNNVAIDRVLLFELYVNEISLNDEWSYAYGNTINIYIGPKDQIDQLKKKNGVAESTDNNGKTAKPASTGTTVSDASTKAKFKVTSSDEGNATVSFEGTKDNASSVVIPSVIKDANGVEYKVTSVSENAFAKNSKIKTVEIPETVTSIGKNAFKGCKNLKNIKLNANTLKTVGKNAFKGIKKNAKITVVSKNKKAYNTFVKKLKRSGAKEARFKFKKG